MSNSSNSLAIREPGLACYMYVCQLLFIVFYKVFPLHSDMLTTYTNRTENRGFFKNNS
jgi:hypothetical protein